MLTRLALGFAALSLTLGSTVAQESCAVGGTIVALSDYVLTQRDALPRLQRRNFGAEAAYLKIRYGLDEAGARALLASLKDKDIRFLNDVALAFYVATDGLAAANEALGTEAMEAALLASASAMRALVLFEAEDVLLNALAALPAERQYAQLQPLYTALIDQPDAVKARVAALATEKGLDGVAAVMAATQRDPEAWQDFVATIDDPQLAADMTRQFWMLPIFASGEPLLGDVEGERLDMRKKSAKVFSAGTVQPELDYLNTFFNYTGLIDESVLAADALLTETYLLKLPFDGPFDAGWLFTYEQLTSMASREVVDDMLRSISVGARPLRANSAEVLDWIAAVAALAPYVSGFVEEVPPAPQGPGGTLPATYKEWVEVAQQVMAEMPPVAFVGDERRLAMAAELMLVSGRYAALEALLEAAPVSSATIGIAEDMAKRIDRAECNAYLRHQAEALLLAGMPIFKFDAAVAAEQPTPTPTPTPDKLKN